MIKFVDSTDYEISEICSKDVFGTRILSYFLTYGIKYDFFKMWVQLSESGKITAALCLIDGSMTLTADEEADADELSVFIGMNSFLTLQCDRNLCRRLGFKESIWGYVVRIENTCDTEKYKSIKLSHTDDFKSIYSIIKDAGLLGVGEYLPWLADVKYRTDAGVSSAVCAFIGDEMCASAMALFITENAALLGAVACRKEHRGKGLAGGAVTLIANEMLSLNKRTELLCKNDSIVEFYRSLGFITVGEWAISEGI